MIKSVALPKRSTRGLITSRLSYNVSASAALQPRRLSQLQAEAARDGGALLPNSTIRDLVLGASSRQAGSICTMETGELSESGFPPRGGWCYILTSPPPGPRHRPHTRAPERPMAEGSLWPPSPEICGSWTGSMLKAKLPGGHL